MTTTQCQERIWDPNKVLKWPFLYQCPNVAVDGSLHCIDHQESETGYYEGT